MTRGVMPPLDEGDRSPRGSHRSHTMVEYLCLPGDVDARYAVVIVPGNPGVGELYALFAQHLQNVFKELFDCKVPVYCITFHGFEQPHPKIVAHDIGSEIDRVRQFMDFTYAREAKPLIVIGHSIGS